MAFKMNTSTMMNIQETHQIVEKHVLFSLDQLNDMLSKVNISRRKSINRLLLTLKMNLMVTRKSNNKNMTSRSKWKTDKEKKK